MEKQCNRCNTIRPISYFHKKAAKRDGYHPTCKECILGHPITVVELPPYHKQCSKCKSILSFSSFNKASKTKDGLSYYCKPCIAKPIKLKRKLVKIEREAKKLASLSLIVEKSCTKCFNVKPLECFPSHRNVCRPCCSKQNNFLRRQRNLKNDFNLTMEEYDNLVINQKYKCKICGIHQSELSYNLVVDHDRNTGKIRNLLCAQCNLLLGNAKDSEVILKNAIKYLRNHGHS